MKKIFYDKNGRVKNPHFPFWKPFSAWGMLWRTLLFLSGLALIAILVALLLRGCKPDRPNWTDPLGRGGGEIPDERQVPDSLRQGEPVKDWGAPLPDMDELPKPDENRIPPVNPDSLIQDPEDSLSQIVPDQIIVFFNSEDVNADIVSFAQQFKKLYPADEYKVVYYNATAGTMLLSVPKQELRQVIEGLTKEIKGIDCLITTNEMLESGQQGDDPALKQQQYAAYYQLIQAPEAWQITMGKPEVKVAIVDSYFDLTHPELSERHLDRIHIPSKTTAVMPPKGTPEPSASHGSHVAGIAIGTAGNGQGAHGIAPLCSWIPISLGQEITAFNLMEGILYAVYRGADVINLSIGRAFPEGVAQVPLGDQVAAAKGTAKVKEQIWNYIYKVAADHKTVICTAAGNDNILMGVDPGKRNNDLVVKVEAVDEKGQKAPFSNFGEVPEQGVEYSTVAAPGVNIHSSVAGGKFADWPGTSMASPFVAGTVALMKSLNPQLTPQQVIAILKQTAKQTDTQHRIGPTIQIKDALEQCGSGEMLNYDDLMKNHELLVGRWRSTYELVIQNQKGEEIDNMWTYLEFSTPDKGVIENHAIKTQKVYRADLSVTWGNGTISITQHGDAVDASGDRLNHDDYLCRPNDDRQLEVHVMRNGQERYSFLLEKIR